MANRSNSVSSPLSHSSTSSTEDEEGNGGISPCEPIMSSPSYVSPSSSPPRSPSPPIPTTFPTHSPPFTLPSLDLESLCRAIQNGTIRRIVVLTGAGISVSSGLPDVRSLHTGLYPQLKQIYKLEKPEQIFDIAHIRTNPAPFYAVLRSLWPGQYPPTPMHHCIALLAQKHLLVRNYTQNIDGLEHLAGIPSELVISVHGSFDTAHCIDCQTPYDTHYVKSEMDQHRIPVCPKCGSLVKPAITLFGEPLPTRYKHHYLDDLESTDCLIVAGTSLQLQPFADMIHRVPKHAIRLLINNQPVAVRKPFSPEKTAELLAMKHSSDPKQRVKYSVIQSMRKGFAFGQPDNDRDIFLQSNCDDGIRYICDLLGWSSELDAAMAFSSISTSTCTSTCASTDPPSSPHLDLSYNFTNLQSVIDHHTTHSYHTTDALVEMITSVQIEEIADVDQHGQQQTQQLNEWDISNHTPTQDQMENIAPTPCHATYTNISNTANASSTFTFSSALASTSPPTSTSTAATSTATATSTSSIFSPTSAFSFASTSASSSSFTLSSDPNFPSTISAPRTSSISMPFLSAFASTPNCTSTFSTTSASASTSTLSLATSHSLPSLSIQVVDDAVPIAVDRTPHRIESPCSPSPDPNREPSAVPCNHHTPQPPSPVFSSDAPVLQSQSPSAPSRAPTPKSTTCTSPYIGRKRRWSHASPHQRRSIPRWEGYANVPHPMETTPLT